MAPAVTFLLAKDANVAVSRLPAGFFMQTLWVYVCMCVHVGVCICVWVCVCVCV